MKLLPNTSTLRTSRGGIVRSGSRARRSALAVVLVFGVAAPVMGQERSPASVRPPKRDCNAQPDNDNRSKAEKINERIDCRTENLNVELSTLVDQACASDGIFTDTQKRNLENMRAHGENARKRSKEAGGFKGIGRKQKSNCYVQEYDKPLNPDGSRAPSDDGNNDGVCTNRGGIKETCAEVLGDGIGDNDGICKTTGNPKEVCVEICESPSNDQDDDNFDDEAAADMEQSLEHAESALAETNQKVAAGLRAFAHAKEALASSSGSGDNCSEILTGVRDVVTLALSLVTDVLSAAYDMFDSGCNQDIVGNNCSAGGVVLAAAKGIAQIIKDGWTYTDDVLTQAGFDKSLQCQEQTAAQQSDIKATADRTEVQLDVTDGRVGVIDGKVDALQVTVGETSDKVEEIERKIDALNARLSEVIDLLNTPQGRQPDFPKKP